MLIIKHLCQIGFVLVDCGFTEMSVWPLFTTGYSECQIGFVSQKEPVAARMGPGVVE